MASIKKETIRWSDKDGQERTAERWVARYRDDAGRQRKKNFTRRVDAKTWLDEVTASIVTGQYVDPKAGKITFKRFYADWSKRQIWLPSTRANADLVAASVTFADMPLGSLRKSHVEQWVKVMSTTLAATTIDTRMTIVRSVLRAAVADRVIATDPSAGVVLPRKRKAEAAMEIPSVEDVGKLLACADQDKRVSTRKGFRAYVALCALAGLRKGEAAGVQVGDVDFLRRQLRVSRQIQRDGSAYAVRPPKYGSERTVYLPDELVTILSEHVAEHTPDGEPDRWLFTVGDGPLYDNAITWRWRATRDAAGLSVRLHSLRHFYASGLIAAGCDVVTVQRAMGHATATTTLNTYSHLWPTAEDRTRAAASDLAKAILAPGTRPVEPKQAADLRRLS